MYVLVSAVIIFLFFCSVFCLLQVYREESTGVVAQAVLSRQPDVMVEMSFTAYSVTQLCVNSPLSWD